jgi:membrane-associated PAP2 superfamily phosphatase
MNRTGLYIAIALAAVVGGIFGIYPELDLKIASLFVKSDYRPDFTFGLRLHPVVWWLREAALWISAALVAPAVLALLLKLVRPRAPMLIPGRAAIFLVATLVLAPGIAVNLGLKDYWSRPRPVDVKQFGGNETFVPWWDPRGDCDKNCSFVSGDVSGTYWTLAPAALAPAPWRPLAYAGALAFGTSVGVIRMMAGGHFASDVFFAGFFTFIIIWLVYATIYRWPSTRTTDRAVERSIENAVGWPLRRFAPARKPRVPRKKSATTRRKTARR